MILSKRNLSVILIFSIIVVVFYQYTAFLIGEQVIKKDDLQEYITTYLDTYKSIIEPPSNLTEEERESFKFYNNYPYSAVGVISDSQGAGIHFIPKSNESYRIIETNERIENRVFPKIPNNVTFNVPTQVFDISGDMNVTFENNSFYGGWAKFSNIRNIGMVNNNGSIFLENSTLRYTNLTNTVSQLIIDTNSTLILDGVSIVSGSEIIRQGNISLNGILIDDKNNIILKESNLKKDWSRKKAEQDAIDALFRELNSITIERSRLKWLGFIEINNLIEDYNQKEKKGVYNENPRERLKDRQKISETASIYGFYPEIYLDLLNKTDDNSFGSKLWGGIETVFTAYSILLIVVFFIEISWNWIKYNKSIKQSLTDEINNIQLIGKVKKIFK